MSVTVVIAHRKKSLGGGLDELRKLLADEGCDNAQLPVPVPASVKVFPASGTNCQS